MTDSEFVAIGKFGRVRGVSGEIYVVPYSGDPQRIKLLSKVYIKVDDRFTEINVQKTSLYSGKSAVKLEAYDTPDDARALTNRELFVKQEQLRKLPDGEYYAFQLEGSTVESVNGELIGSLVSVEHFPSSDVYVIENAEGCKFRLPAVNEFIRRIDIKNKLIVIDPPDGWQEITT